MATYYVSSSYTGGTSNGSLSTPWKSLSQVQSSMSAFQPGDSILFKCGDTFSGTLTVNKSGTALAPIKFGSYGSGNKPKFIGTGAQISHLFYMYNRSYIIFDNLWITDTSISPTDRTVQSKIQRAFTFDGTINSYNTISNCKIELVGVGAYWVSGYNTMTKCDIGNLRMVVNTNDGPPPGNDDDYGANPIVISSSNNTISENYFHDCWAQSFDYGVDGGAIDIYADVPLIENTLITKNTFVDCNGVIEIGGSGGNTVTDTILSYNKCINNGSISYVSNSGGFATTVTNLQFYNNIIVESEPYRISSSACFAFKASATTASSLVLKNNVVQLYGTIDVCRAQWGTAGALVSQNNVYKLGSGSVLNFTPHSSETITTSVIWKDTTNANPLYWDFTPAVNSILINSGTTVGYTQDINGNTIVGNPDIGIIEYNQAIPQPLNISVSFTPILINGGLSTVTVGASGGVPPYSGTGTFSRQAGTHEFTVTDASGSTATKSVTISQVAQLVVTANYSQITTINGTTSVTLNASGGASPYRYSRDNVTFVTGNVFSGLTAGTYTFHVIDANSARTSTTLTLTQPISPFVISGLTVRTKNGTTPLSYSIDNSIFSTNATFSNLVAGRTYTIRAKDGQGVIRTMTVTIQS